jgi:hypothetical protein
MNSDAIKCLELGWRMIPLIGKRPVISSWPSKAYGDPFEVASAPRHDGWGVLLGQASGIIDVECDSPEAYEELLELTQGEIDTVCWQSQRGKHFIFKWSPDWPEIAAFKFSEIEFRIGNRGAQSVIPTSGGRRWINAPWDHEVQDFRWMDILEANCDRVRSASLV